MHANGDELQSIDDGRDDDVDHSSAMKDANGDVTCQRQMGRKRMTKMKKMMCEERIHIQVDGRSEHEPKRAVRPAAHEV